MDENVENVTPKRKKNNVTGTTIAVIVFILVFGVVLFSSFFKVDATEQAVITRFGKYQTTVGPGLHLKLPFGIEKNYNVPVKVVQTEQFGFTTDRNVSKSQLSNLSKESTML